MRTKQAGVRLGRELLKHLKYWLLALCVSLALFALGAFLLCHALPPAYEDAGVRKLSHTLNEIRKAAETAPRPSGGAGELALSASLARVIFLNNAELDALFAVPFVGPGFYAVSMAETGAVGRYVAELVAGSAWQEYLFSKVLASPHTYLEFLAYSVASCESLILSAKIAKRSTGRGDLLVYVASLAISFATLYVAAVLETALII